MNRQWVSIIGQKIALIVRVNFEKTDDGRAWFYVPASRRYNWTKTLINQLEDGGTYEIRYRLMSLAVKTRCTFQRVTPYMHGFYINSVKS